MTFSLVLAAPGASLLGAATSSFSLGVGNAVPWVEPGVGAVVSQAWTNRSLRGQLLASVRRGVAVAEAVAAVPDLDEGHRWRQVGLVDADGHAGAHTGAGCTPWAGSVALGTGSVRGVGCANLVAGAGVLDAVAGIVDRAREPRGAGDLARLMLDALAAGQAAGGDVRGQQSACLLVGEGPGQAWHPPDLAVDLRVDDDVAPLAVLDRMLTARAG